MEIANALWVEKYRPKKLDDLILSERYKKDFSKIIARKQLSNLLFSGPPGGGKSTLARILCSKEGVLFNKKDNVLVVNGSFTWPADNSITGDPEFIDLVNNDYHLQCSSPCIDFSSR